SAPARRRAGRRGEPSVNPPRLRHHIGGGWTDPVSGREHDDHDPWTGGVIATVASGDAEDAKLAIAAAREAFDGWSRSLPGERQAIFLRAAEILARRRDEVSDLLAAETGCGRIFASVQLDFSLSLLRQASGLGYAPTGESLPSDIPGTQAFALRRPVGVV